jgi:integrase
MPLKLVPPSAARRTPNYSVRGTYLGCHVDRSTGTGERRLALRILRRIEREIERGAVAGPAPLGFAAAAAAYMKAGGDAKYLAPLIKHFVHTPIGDIDQMAIDTAAAALYPDATAATRNRQVYTPLSAVLKRAGCEKKIKRPVGWRGRKLTHWLTPAQAQAIFDATGAIDAPAATRLRFRVYLRLLAYTGMRRSEPLRARRGAVDLDRATLLLRGTKNGRDRLVHLPPIVVEELREMFALDEAEAGRPIGDDARLFPFHAGGRHYDLWRMTLAIARITLPPRVAFHVWCHSWATWMRQHGGLDTFDLVKTDRWADPASADRYAHVVVSDQAKRADLLPGAKRRA